MKNLLLLITVLILPLHSFSQQLARRASWQASIQRPNNQVPGATIQSIEKGSPLEEAGLKEGDKIIRVDDRNITTTEDWSAATYAIRSGRPTHLEIKRKGTWFSKSLSLNPLEKEDHPGLTTYYESIVNDYGIRQRTIITTPDPDRKLPAIFLVQGLSCSTIEKYSGRSNNWVNMIEQLVRASGMVVMRVDKPGVGDSEGDCGCTDFKTELNGYESALKSLKSKPYVDTTKIVVYGSSMGSALAPWLANRHGLSGVISDGTFFKTWFEHMLEIERRILKMKGNDELTIHKMMNQAFIPLYYGMLIQKKSYQEIIEDYPALKDFNYHRPHHMYGRGMTYYHQVQEFNFANAWQEVRVPVRILYGSNDWIMSKEDNYMIMELLDQSGHQNHQLHIYPGLDHWNTIHKSPDDSFHGRPGTWDPDLPKLVIGWAREMVQ